MIPDEYIDLCELYALGALDANERLEFECHLTDCPDCRAGMQRAVELNEIIIAATQIVEPDPQLRGRVLAAFGHPAKNPRHGFNWTVALAAAAALLFTVTAWITERNTRLATTDELVRLREIQQILAAPTTKQVTFGPQPAAPHGSIFVHERLGMILIADGLAVPPAGWRYESWIVPKDGAPLPIEAFTAHDGRGVSLLPSKLPIDQLKAVAVSLEPNNAPVTKPTKLVFAAPLG